MKRLTIIYHSQSGSTEAMAQAVWRGAITEPEVESRLVRAFDAGLDDLVASDAVIFGTPENFGTMSGALKDFFDRTYGPALPLQLNRPYALFVSAGNDGSGALREIRRILRGYPLREVAEAVVATTGREPGSLAAKPLDDVASARCAELGATLAAGLALGIF